MKTTEELRALLRAEGLGDDEISLDPKRGNVVFQNDLGFFVYRVEHGYPYLTHFFLFEDKRTGMNFIDLYREFKWAIVKAGYVEFIAEVIPGLRETFTNIIHALGSEKPYAAMDDGREYYLVRVRGAKHEEILQQACN